MDRIFLFGSLGVMGWFRGLTGNELCGHYHQTECNAGTGIVCFEDAIALIHGLNMNDSEGDSHPLYAAANPRGGNMERQREQTKPYRRIPAMRL